jgi:hypothetical protein
LDRAAGEAEMKEIAFPLSLATGGLICALIVLAAAEALGGEEHGGGNRSFRCTSFFVGLRHPGDTHVYLVNDGREDVTAHLELIDENGNRHTAERYSLGPYATSDVLLGRLPPEFGIKVSSTSVDLRVHAEVVFNNGSESEQFRAGRCG